MSVKTKLSAILGTALLTLALAPASATVVTFTNFTGGASYTEAGLTMTGGNVSIWPTAGLAHMDGGVAVFKLASGFDFNLNAVELIAAGGTGTARFTGYNNGVLQSTVDIATRGAFAFGTGFDRIDEFRISVVNQHFSFDNLSFDAAAAAVPEPDALALFGLGLAGLSVAARRRASKASKQA